MKTRLLHWWGYLNSSYWFVPALMLAAAATLAYLTLYIDSRALLTPKGFGWLYGGGVEGARTLLGTVASSVITVAGVVFSITIATLTQASTQFGPRLLRNFMGDTGNQVVLGTFVSTFAYCLLVLRTIYGGEDGEGNVPHLSVTTAMALAGASIGVLIFFIHHVARSIQAPYLVAAVGAELDRAVTQLFPEELGEPARREPGDSDADVPPPETFAENARRINAPRSGYVQAIDDDGLMTTAREADVIVRLEVRPGDFIIRDLPLMHVYPPERVSDEICRRLEQSFIIGRSRTPEQDVEYAINQLVEIAVRALSPGINDPFTACTCVDWLGAALCRLAGRKFPSPLRCDEEEGDPQRRRLRVIARASDFGGLCDAAFNQIRQYGAGSVAVTLRLLETIERIATCCRTEEQRAVLLRHARMIEEPGRQPFDEGEDRLDLRHRVAAAIDAIRAGAPG